jgi:hypothetical protein
MKTKILSVINVFLLLGIVSMSMVSCKSKQKVVNTEDLGEVELIIPCSGSDYQSNSKVLRYSALGESMDQMTAKKKAMSEARAGLAASLSTLVKGVTDNYVKSGNFNNAEELMTRYEGLTREVIDQSINGSVVICEKATITKSRTYKYYVCVELGSNDIFEQINKKATSNEMLKVDYNYEKFKKTFEEEMSKLGK